MSTLPIEHDHIKDAISASFQVAIAMFFPQASWLIPVLMFLGGEKRRQSSEDWQIAVHGAIQELNRRITVFEGGIQHQRKIEGLSHLIAVYLVENLADHLSGTISREILLEGFKTICTSEIDESVMELQEDGHVKLRSAIGHLYIGTNPMPELIFTYDPLIFGWSPPTDAVALYRLMEEQSAMQSMMHLRSVISWRLRRFNSAQLFLKEKIFYDGLYSKTLHPDLIVPSFMPHPTQRIRIKRLADELENKGITIPEIQLLG
jgi:hypothetical protein